MYFSRVTFNPLVDSQQLVEELCHDNYREHQAIWGLFDRNPEAKRDFLYRQVIENGRIKYYILSKRVPVDDSGVWLIDPPKPYDPKLSEGQALFFTLRVNPVITISTDDGKKQRHDVVMHEKKRIGYDKIPPNKKPALQSLIQSSCTQWLLGRGDANGFSIDPELVSVEGYQQHNSNGKKGNRAIKYSSADIQGTLTVVDPDLFRQALYNGLGKSKAFGCGLILVRRV